MPNVKYLIIPDVHGRTFWREIVDTTLNDWRDIKVVFLGDYLDPYQYEGITPDDAIPVFDEIIGLKKSNPDRITLLLGNHDLHYVMNDRRGCRMDMRNKQRIVDMFRRNFDLFDMCLFDEVGGKNFIFSHAGFTRAWVNHRINVIKPEWLYSLNANDIYYGIGYSMLKEIDWKGLLRKSRIFSDVSFYRGGEDPFSSFLWTDLDEMILAEDPIDAVQVFGHSQQDSDPVKYKDCYCLDCRKSFILTDDGVVRHLNHLAVEDNTSMIDDRMKAKSEAMSKYMGFFL